MIKSTMELHSFCKYANYMLQGAVNSIKKDLMPGATIKEPDYLAAIVTKFPALMNTMWGNVRFGGSTFTKSLTSQPRMEEIRVRQVTCWYFAEKWVKER